jgi:cobalt-zinc-cadmium efflux system protein
MEDGHSHVHASGHPHAHDHEHGHAHEGMFHIHAPASGLRRAFWWTLVIFAVEAVGGLLSNSLALLSDAGHVLTDVAAIALSWYALRQSERPPTERMTFGYHRTGILAALANAVVLILVAVAIAWEALQRLHHPVAVHSTWMFVSAAVGLSVNLALGLTMRHHRDLNVRSAVLHMMGDALASAGVIVAGVFIAVTGWVWVDPLLSIVIALLIAGGAWRIVRQAVSILMESAPAHLPVRDIAALIESVPGVVGVHDLHLWSLSAGRHALSCHVVLDGNPTLQETQRIVREIETRLRLRHIDHATIQAEDIHHLHDSSLLCSDAGRTS